MSANDFEFVRNHRVATNRLGVAEQLCTLRWLGFVPDDLARAPTLIVACLGNQFDVDVEVLGSDGDRDQTRAVSRGVVDLPR